MRRVDVDLGFARLRHSREARRGGSDDDGTLVDADSTVTGNDLRARVNERQPVDLSGRHLNATADGRREAAPADAQTRVERSVGHIVGEAEGVQRLGHSRGRYVGVERVDGRTRRQRTDRPVDVCVGSPDRAEHAPQSNGVAREMHFARPGEPVVRDAPRLDDDTAVERRCRRTGSQISGCIKTAGRERQSDSAQLRRMEPVGDQGDSRAAGGAIRRREREASRRDDASARGASICRVDLQAVFFNRKRQARAFDRNAAQRCVVHRQVRALNDDAISRDGDADGAGDAPVSGYGTAEKRLQTLKGPGVTPQCDELLRRETAAAAERAPWTGSVQGVDRRLRERPPEAAPRDGRTSRRRSSRRHP